MMVVKDVGLRILKDAARITVTTIIVNTLVELTWPRIKNAIQIHKIKVERKHKNKKQQADNIEDPLTKDFQQAFDGIEKLVDELA